MPLNVQGQGPKYNAPNYVNQNKQKGDKDQKVKSGNTGSQLESTDGSIAKDSGTVVVENGTETTKQNAGGLNINLTGGDKAKFNADDAADKIKDDKDVKAALEGISAEEIKKGSSEKVQAALSIIQEKTDASTAEQAKSIAL